MVSIHLALPSAGCRRSLSEAGLLTALAVTFVHAGRLKLPPMGFAFLGSTSADRATRQLGATQPIAVARPACGE
jgi:hypothetical protein